jgi:sec-independent protein translocase protein TatB
MFDLSWSHIAILVVVALLVLGPKELPNAIRTGAQLLRTGRKLAGEFRSGIDELIREAELDETRRSIQEAMEGGLGNTIAQHVDPTGEIKNAISSNPLSEVEAAEQAGNIVEHDAPPASPHSLEPPPEIAPAPASLPEPRVPEPTVPEASAAEPGAVPPADVTPMSDADEDLKKKSA